MLGSEVPPCRTITFDGGQFFEAFDVPEAGGFPAAGESAAELAGVLLQSAGGTLFLRHDFFRGVGWGVPEEPCPAEAAGGAAEIGGSLGVEGDWAGGAAGWSCAAVSVAD